MMIHDHHLDSRPPSPGKLIEVFGPAAVGKSSITEALARRVDGYQFAYRLSKWRHAHRFLRHAVTCGPAVPCKLLFGSGGGRLRAKERVYLEVLYDVLKHRTLPGRRADDAGGIFFDQGPLHVISDLHPSNNELGELRAAPPSWYAQLKRWSNTLDVVVALDAPVDTIVQRVLDRKKDHRLYRWIKDLPSQDATRLIEAHVTTYQQMLDGLAGGTAQVLSFDTTQQSVEAITEAIINDCRMPTVAGTSRVHAASSDVDTAEDVIAENQRK